MIYLLPHMIDESAAATPDAIAFRCDQSELSFAQLSTTTNQLARTLREGGVRRGDRVGVLMPRCIASATAVFGIMKAGAAYVPLDPHAPVAALRDLIEFCGLRCIVTDGMKGAKLDQLVSGSPKLKMIVGSAPLTTDHVWIPWAQVDECEDKPVSAVSLEQDLAYILFTSGSTGRPKGIMHTHYSGLSYARLSVETYGVDRDDAIGSHSPLHFDMSTFGYFSGPLAGATTVLIPEAHIRLPASLSQLMEREKITIWYSVPFALIQLSMHGVLESRDLPSLRWVVFAGEAFPPKHLYSLMRQWPQARFSNVYGPTEVNQCTYYHVPPGDCLSQESIGDGPSPIPIGTTWANTEALVVNENDECVEPGEAGELLIRSSTMMQGYWTRPDLTEAAFFRRTGRSGIAEAFYRTGDSVRERPDKLYEFLGRKDRQIKVRGYRVELDSIEQALSSHPAVEEAAAFSIRDAADLVTIKSSVTIRSGSAADAAALTAHVADRLPWYAVPTEVTIRESLPRTTSGKIDRRKLADEDSDRAE